MKNRTKAQILEEMADLRRQIDILQISAQRGELAERNLNKWVVETRERTKELECLYGISEVIEGNGSRDSMLQKIVNLIPASWQHPAITSARIMVDDHEYRTDVFHESNACQSCDILAFGRQVGMVEVTCFESQTGMAGEVFLQSEIHLLKAIAERIGKLLEQIELDEDLRNSHVKLRNLFEHMETVREEERKRISHEIHDEVGQSLTSLKMDLKQLKSAAMPNKKSLDERIESMVTLIDATIENIQRIVFELSPVMLDHCGLAEAVQWYAKEFRNRTGIQCLADMHIDKAFIDKELGILLYRIIQELLTNVARHSKASRVKLELGPVKDRLLLKVTDNGIGITNAQITDPHSFGLMSLQERIGYRGGEVSIRGIANQGTTVSILLPQTTRSSSKIRILIADDHPITREGLKKIIAENTDMTVADEAGSGMEVLTKTWSNDYDVVLLDISFPDRDGLEILELIKARKPGLPVLMLSIYPEEQYAMRSLKAGAAGYLSKKSIADELLKAIRMVSQGRQYVSPTLAEELASRLNMDFEGSRHEILTDREFLIMRLLGQGKSANEIAHELSLSPKTVFTHRSHILSKLNLKSNVDIIRYTMENHLV